MQKVVRVFKVSNAVWVIGINLMDGAKLTPVPFDECVFVSSHPFFNHLVCPWGRFWVMKRGSVIKHWFIFYSCGFGGGVGLSSETYLLLFCLLRAAAEEWMSRLLECLIGRQMHLAGSRDLWRQLTRSSSGVSQGSANMPSPCKDHPSGLEEHIFICVSCLFFVCLSNIQLFVAAATASSWRKTSALSLLQPLCWCVFPLCLTQLVYMTV